MPETIEPCPRCSGSARERILQTAHDLFYREGIRATGVDRLIAQAGVTKVTFYRHFASKNDLIRAFLIFRHERWTSWFKEALARHRSRQSASERQSAPLAPVRHALAEWLQDPSFRGCAFINAVAEIGGVFPDALSISASHKEEMVVAIASLLPSGGNSMALARAAALGVDGAIVRAQTGSDSMRSALEALGELLASLAAHSQ